jgi:NAD-specific glutamate dehydrogenase
MTDSENSSFPNWDHYQTALTSANASNQATVFEALATAGIQSVIVEFDGEGDSGQIESMQAYVGERPVPIPQSVLTMRHIVWGATSERTMELSLSEAVETLCYSFLTQEHDGWENNEGAYGEFAFDVQARTIELEHNARYRDVITHNHSF